MKNLAILIFVFSPILTIGQPSETVEQLTTLYSENALLSDNSLRYNSADKLLILSGYKISITNNTLFRAVTDKSEKNKYHVKFFCQNGTTITHQDKPEEKHAYLTIPLKSKQASKQFIKLLSKLKS